MLGLALILAAGAILLLVLITKAYGIEARIGELEERLGMLEREQREMVALARATPMPSPPSEPRSGPLPAAAAGPAEATPAPAAAAEEPATPETPAPEFAPPSLTDTRPIPEPPPPEPVPVPTSRTREEWEALIGGRLLNRIGALALIIGVGFFLQSHMPW